MCKPMSVSRLREWRSETRSDKMPKTLTLCLAHSHEYAEQVIIMSSNDMIWQNSSRDLGSTSDVIYKYGSTCLQLHREFNEGLLKHDKTNSAKVKVWSCSF